MKGRSLFEIIFDMLQVIADGVEVPTRIIQAAFVQSSYAKLLPVLESKGLVVSERHGAYRRYKATVKGFNLANDYIRLKQAVNPLKWRGKVGQLQVFCTFCDGGGHDLCIGGSCLCRKINPELHRKTIINEVPATTGNEREGVPRGTRETAQPPIQETARIPLQRNGWRSEESDKT